MSVNALIIPAGHAGSLVAILATFAGALPPLVAFIASLGAATFYCIQVYESRPIQAWLNKRKSDVSPSNPGTPS